MDTQIPELRAEAARATVTAKGIQEAEASVTPTMALHRPQGWTRRNNNQGRSKCNGPVATLP